MIKAFWEYLFLGIFCAVGVYPLSAQEVNATVKVNSSAVQGGQTGSCLSHSKMRCIPLLTAEDGLKPITGGRVNG